MIHYASFGNGYTKAFCNDTPATGHNLQVTFDAEAVDCRECREQIDTAIVAARLRGLNFFTPTLSAAPPNAQTTVQVPSGWQLKPEQIVGRPYLEIEPKQAVTATRFERIMRRLGRLLHGL